MPEPVVYWRGSALTWRTGDGALTVIWCLSPAEVPAAKPARKGKRA